MPVEGLITEEAIYKIAGLSVAILGVFIGVIVRLFTGGIYAKIDNINNSLGATITSNHEILGKDINYLSSREEENHDNIEKIRESMVQHLEKHHST